MFQDIRFFCDKANIDWIPKETLEKVMFKGSINPEGAYTYGDKARRSKVSRAMSEIGKRWIEYYKGLMARPSWWPVCCWDVDGFGTPCMFSVPRREKESPAASCGISMSFMRLNEANTSQLRQQLTAGVYSAIEGTHRRVTCRRARVTLGDGAVYETPRCDLKFVHSGSWDDNSVFAQMFDGTEKSQRKGLGSVHHERILPLFSVNTGGWENYHRWPFNGWLMSMRAYLEMEQVMWKDFSVMLEALGMPEKHVLRHSPGAGIWENNRSLGSEYHSGEYTANLISSDGTLGSDWTWPIVTPVIKDW
jgi:hypothetical protein